jgi:hypothetical protein
LAARPLEGCTIPNGSPQVRLNAAALTDPNAFSVDCSIPDISASHFRTLIDSGSSDCFLDQTYADVNSIPLYSIPPLPLRLLDGSVGSWLTSAADLTIRFFSGEEFHIKVFLTTLDAPYPLVLGHNWLCRYNLLIDWQKGSILSFGSVNNSPQTSLGEGSEPLVETPLSSASISTSDFTPPDISPPVSVSTPPPISKPLIALVNAAAFQRAARLPGSTQFQIALNSLDSAIQARAASSSTPSPDLSAVPPEYHEFADVFSKERAYHLPEHWPYDLTIDLEPGATIPPNRIYSISHSEMQALK